MKKIEEEQSNQKHILNIIDSTGVIAEEIDGIKEATLLVNEQSDNINRSMDEILSGAYETAETLQKQMEMTSQIEEIIGKTQKTLSIKMRDDFKKLRIKLMRMNDMQELNDSSKVIEEVMTKWSMQ